MAELLILLRRDPQSGKQNIVVKLHSDPDALPIEHEQLHKTLVEKLIGKGLNPSDLGEILVERDGSAVSGRARGHDTDAERETLSEGQ